jgi:hypothetical protein
MVQDLSKVLNLSALGYSLKKPSFAALATAAGESTRRRTAAKSAEESE